MSFTKNAVELIKHFEGCRFKAYKCPAGVWTIGYGHTHGVTSGMSIDMDKAVVYLYDDLEKFDKMVKEAEKRFGYVFAQNEVDALISFAFNIGGVNQLLTGYKTGKGKPRTKDVIADKMLEYCKSKGSFSNGLYERRKVEAMLFSSSDKYTLRNIEVKTGVKMKAYEDEELPDADVFIYNAKDKSLAYHIGQTYHTNTGLNVREEPSMHGRRLSHDELTKNAKLHDIHPKNGSLDAGTAVTCLDLKVDELGNLWMRIPSGWICAYRYDYDNGYVD